MSASARALIYIVLLTVCAMSVDLLDYFVLTLGFWPVVVAEWVLRIGLMVVAIHAAQDVLRTHHEAVRASYVGWHLRATTQAWPEASERAPRSGRDDAAR